MHPPVDFAARLRHLRLKRKLTMRALASSVGVSAPSIFQWEHGTHARPDHLKALAEALLVSPSYFYLEDGSEDAQEHCLDEAIADARALISSRTGLPLEATDIRITACSNLLKRSRR